MLFRYVICGLVAALTVACEGDDQQFFLTAADTGDNGRPDAGGDTQVGPLEHDDEAVIYDFANTCVRVGVDSGDATRWLRLWEDGSIYGFDGTINDATPFFMKPSALGTYLFYDPDRAYLYADGDAIERATQLASDLTEVDDSYVSGAEWVLEFSERRSFRFQLKHRRSGGYLGSTAVVEDAASASAILIEAAEGCSEHPEMSLDAAGTVSKSTFDDGDLFGIVDTHSHILANFGFGGGGVFHGSPFHRLGVEHAMMDCELFHGPEGRADFLGWGFGSGQANSSELNTNQLVALLGTGMLPDPNHNTDGWPTFSDWPSPRSSTHQTQYYKWLERAWMAGLRLMVQHAVSNEAMCDVTVDTEFQPARYGCEDMLAVDRQLLEVREMEKYIDAQSGGPGEGWFKVVESPQQAREVIADGKLAIVLGIELPNLFDCYLTRREGGPECDAEHIASELDFYYAQGIRVLFPNHKYDNAFTPGDGHRGIIELGNFVTTAHWSNYTEDCPDVNTVFDKGPVTFGGLNQPRDEYQAAAPNELIEFSTSPLNDLLPYAMLLTEPELEGDWCQKGSLTDAGRTLIEGMMDRGMLIELDHLPRRSYLAAFDLLVAANYPALGTHGNTNNGALYDLGGVSKSGFRRCPDPAVPGAMFDRFRQRRDMIAAAGNYPAEGFGFDLNGFAGYASPRFSDSCTGQQNPVEYPFASYDGDITFTQPFIGQRQVDFNTEGMYHIGLLPELIEDARRTGVTDEDLEFIFRSAEGYIRMWELAEERAAAR